MRQTRLVTACLALTLVTLVGLCAAAEDDETEFRPIFDGKTLAGWDGNPKFWSVRDGAITGQTTEDNPTRGNTFIIWREGKPGDFELRLQFRIVGGNSGIQYRSREGEKWVIAGYQADFDGAKAWTGSLYEERGRGVLARRGHRVVIRKNGEKDVVGQTTPAQDIVASLGKKEWNDYAICARGNQITQSVNGLLTVAVTDNEAARRKLTGLLALQLHAGPPMTAQFRHLRLKLRVPAQ